MISFTALIDNRTNREVTVISVKLIESIKLFGKETGNLKKGIVEIYFNKMKCYF